MKRIFLSMVLGYAFTAGAAINSATESAARSLGANMVSEISFEEGKASLTADAKRELREFVSSARGSGKVDEVKVPVWADREYPITDSKASDGDVKLADDRAKEVKNYLKDQLKVSSVTTYNMAERPNSMQDLFKTEQAKTKNTLESKGAAPQTESETGFLGLKGQASKALVMVYLKK